MRVFPYLTAALELGAAIVYLHQLAFVWFCYAAACLGLAGVE